MEEFEKKIVETMIPAVISELLLNEEITGNSSDEEVKQAILSYLRSEQLNSMNVAITIGNEFEKAIKNAIELKQNNVAIALAGICLEQMTNEFYQKVLLNKFEFSNREYSACMKCVSVKDKLTWLYKLTTSQSIENDIINIVQKVCGLRNNIVHYKPRIESIGEWGEKEDENKKLDVNELIPLIDRIKIIFSEACQDSFPEDKWAQEIFEKVFKEK
jgi:hypothetical protein